MVSDAAEWLERDDIIHSVSDITHDVGRQEPAFSKLCCQRNQSLHILRIIINIGEWTEVAEPAGCLVHLAQSSAYQCLISTLDDEVWYLGTIQSHVLLYLYIHEFLKEERSE